MSKFEVGDYVISDDLRWRSTIWRVVSVPVNTGCLHCQVVFRNWGATECVVRMLDTQALSKITPADATFIMLGGKVDE